MDRFLQFFKLLMYLEGNYSNVSQDKGGKTRYGITEAVLKSYDPSLHIEDLDLETAKNIYKSLYFDKVYAHTDPKVHYHYFVLCFNSGHGNYIKCRRQTKDILEVIVVWRKNFYYGVVKSDPLQQVFYKGWLNRLKIIGEFKFI